MSARRERLKGCYPDATSHAGLWLDKFIASHDPAETNSRRDLVRHVAAIGAPKEYAGYFERWKAALGEIGARTRAAVVQGRMAVGLGAEGVLETSITLHRTYGVPYIPGSALKGLASHYARRRFGGEWQRDEEAHITLFGSADVAGYVTFFDALPLPGAALQPDVITVHHADYYQGRSETPPADWDDPNPVQFLSATGSYLIALAAPSGWGAWLETAFEILGEALKNEGVGAKTSSGYGVLLVQPDPDQAEADRLIRAVEAIRVNDLASQLGQRAADLLKSQISETQKRRVAGAILRRVGTLDKQATKRFKEKLWYQQVQEISGEGQD